jgi:DNA-binding response OmpR family regulator
MGLLERTLSLVCEELALEPDAHRRANARPTPATDPPLPVIDRDLLAVTLGDRACFLGNTLDFRFLARLARRPNSYVTYDTLLADVWGGDVRSDGAVRSVAKRLRARLRAAGLADLAAAVDGSVPGHYALRLAG